MDKGTARQFAESESQVCGEREQKRSASPAHVDTGQHRGRIGKASSRPGFGKTVETVVETVRRDRPAVQFSGRANLGCVAMNSATT